MPKKLGLNSDMFETLRLHLSTEITAMTKQALDRNRVAEITLKLTIEPHERREYEQMTLIAEWNELKVEYKLTSKIKELKSDFKHTIGDGYEVFEDDEGVLRVEEVDPDAKPLRLVK